MCAHLRYARAVGISPRSSFARDTHHTPAALLHSRAPRRCARAAHIPSLGPYWGIPGAHGCGCAHAPRRAAALRRSAFPCGRWWGRPRFREASAAGPNILDIWSIRHFARARAFPQPRLAMGNRAIRAAKRPRSAAAGFARRGDAAQRAKHAAARAAPPAGGRQGLPGPLWGPGARLSARPCGSVRRRVRRHLGCAAHRVEPSGGQEGRKARERRSAQRARRAAPRSVTPEGSASRLQAPKARQRTWKC